MTDRSSQLDWVIFLLLGFFWGSSYLFIKLAVDDFGTFTLVALRLVVGAILLWLVIRIAGQRLPRERRIYGHLVVMSIINITIPFLLITWAEQSVESSLAAILTSPVPLFAIVLSAIFLPDEPMRVNGAGGSRGRVHRRRDHHQSRADGRGVVGDRARSPCSGPRSATRPERCIRGATSVGSHR